MEFKVFKSKKLNGAKNKLFLAQPTMMFKSLSPSESYMIAKHIVKDDDVVRPDRVAVEHYGTTDGLDIILKFNGISDPFSLSPGETLWIPIDTISYYKLESPKAFEENPIKNQFIDTKRLSKTDQRRLEALKKKYNKEALLPPNVIPLGKKTYQFDGTNVRLGMHVQTDDVVNSILSDIREGELSTNSIDTIDLNDEDVLVINTSDDLNSGNSGSGNSGSGNSGSGNSGNGNSGNDGTTNGDNDSSGSNSSLYEDALIKNSGNYIKSSGSGAGSIGGAGLNGSGSGKSDKADILGGNIPDGSGPVSTGNNTSGGGTDSSDSPCSK